MQLQCVFLSLNKIIIMKRLFAVLILTLLSLTGFGQVEKTVDWTFETQMISKNEVMLIFKAKIEEGWHLYSPYNPPGGSLPLVFSYNDTSKFQLEGKIIEQPKPTIVYDDIFGKDEYFFEHQATFKQKIKVLSTEDFTLTGQLDGQTCLPDGKCINFTEDFSFPIKGVKTVTKKTTPVKNTDTLKNNNPFKKDSVKNDTVKKETIVPINIDTNRQISSDTALKVSLVPTGKTPILVNSSQITTTGKKKSLFGFFILAFILGLAALLTPCVFPMIPMTISFFIKDQNTKKGKINASLYGLNIVLIYTLPIAILILIAQLFGAGQSVSGDFANFLSTHWLPNILFFIIFMIFAISFFGAFEITLPHQWVNKTSQKSSKTGFWGIFFMAFTLVLVSFSCTGPIVGAVLIESTQGNLILKPIVGILGFSLGVAAPFTLFAFFPSWLQNLPKSGGWLNSVKVVLGFIELAFGMKFLSVADQTYHWHLLNRDIYLALWIVIFTMMGFYLLGKLKFAHDSDVKHISITRLILAILTFSFVVYMIPGMWGAPLKILSGYLPPKSTQEFDIERMTTGVYSVNITEKPMYADKLELPHGLQAYFDVYQALNAAKELNKPIFVDFTGHGCVNCRKMEEFVWSDPAVLKRLKEDFVILSLYVDDKVIKTPKDRWFVSLADGKEKKMLGKQNADIEIVNFHSNAQPLYALIDWQGNLLTQPTEFNSNVDDFIKFLDEGKKKFNLLHPRK